MADQTTEGKTETTTALKYRTFSNRGNINEFYFMRYEDCIDRMVEALQAKEELDDTDAELEFKKRLIGLYWSVVLPRKKNINTDVFSEAPFDKIMTLRELSKIPVSSCVTYLKKIGEYLFDLGVIKVENPNPDLSHIFISKLEARRPHHGTL